MILVTATRPRARWRTMTATAALAVVTVVTACSSTPGAETPSPTPSSSATDQSGTEGTPTAGPIEVTGTVTEGVEEGCLVLTDQGTTYLLLGEHDELVDGAEVTVEGTLADDGATTCQQGTPLEVQSVRPR